MHVRLYVGRYFLTLMMPCRVEYIRIFFFKYTSALSVVHSLNLSGLPGQNNIPVIFLTFTVL